MTTLYEQMQALSPVKRELLGVLARRQDIDLAQLPIERLPDGAGAPLSYIQRSLAFLNRLVPDSPAYNVERCMRLRGVLDAGALERSLARILRRHDVLRTRCCYRDGEAFQHVRPFDGFELPLTDLSGSDDPAAAAQALATRIACRPFDLEAGPLLRAELLRLGDQDHLLVVVLHHFVTDGFSDAIFARELKAHYEAIRAGADSAGLEPLPVQYADYAAWERLRVDSRSLQDQVDFWKQKLAGLPPVLELPTDRPRPGVESFHGRTRCFELDDELSAALQALAGRQGVTLYTLLMAAYQVLLFRYSRQTSFAVATAVSNRSRPELENLIGCFANNVVLRADFSAPLTFTELLQQVSDTAMEAFSQQDLPFEKLVEELHPQRDLSHNPIFQVGFELHQEDMVANLAIEGLEVSVMAVEKGTAMYDLDIAMVAGAARLTGAIEYNTDLFDDATIDRMLGHFTNLLRAVVADPDRPVHGLSMLDEAERRLLLDGASGDAASVFEDAPVHLLIERQAAQRPGAPALRHGGRRLSYAELNGAANALAARLLAAGVGRGDLVGVYLDRCVELPVAVLGVLKAGAAYVPIDPAYPEERVRFMIGDAAMPLILSRDAIASSLPSGGPQVLNVETVASGAAPAAANPGVDVRPGDLAYVIYTSGSTGQPKGVQIEHGSLTAYIDCVVGVYGLTDADRALQFSSISFDTSVEEIFSTLVAGAELVLRDDAMLESAGRFLRTCEDWDITLINLPTAYWHDLVGGMEHEGLALPASVRAVVIGGEKAVPERVASWFRLVGRDIPLLNSYGPTETTIAVSCCDLAALPGDFSDGRRVPIGRALADSRLYVLDERRQLVPVGVPGELCVGGICLSRGYLNRDDLTAGAFVDDPFNPGERLYRTGDLVRRLPDGNIEYIGRLDHQIKLRGFRIEPGEIEALLDRLPEVSQSLVMVREDVPGQPRLVAYVLAAGEGRAPAAGRLIEYLRGELPEYMIPSAFVMLEAFPLTPNGKVDRARLPVPEAGGRAASAAGGEAPATPTEERLAQIWAEVLGLQRVGVSDDFFAIGGHSLLATRVVARVRDDFGVDIPLLSIFRTPTVAALAQQIDALPGGGQEREEFEF